ncbi:MAG: hypothetical protein AVDCRST_MAG93-8085 [uncultured Chloroflexia bacterium]|uniref:Uncharacterized protein n=1 Tax=uncultured Chloroflexia bacterium TaxID=1672391 RepID=A0A6J4MSF3_9CHLR|nr:MAG: hypothetical protein AVDCRST_MAG93-8085 [uncultured Chloroflexia bacterium]
MSSKNSNRTGSTISTRRALIGGATLGAAAVVVGAVKPSVAQATQGQPIVAGDLNFETQPTILVNVGDNTQTSGSALQVQSADHGGIGLRALANGGDGSPAVQAHSFTGNGVTGETQSAFTSGVYGQNNGGGFGVAGRSNNNRGTGVFGEAKGTNGIALRGLAGSGGTALKVEGKARFDRSGKVTIPAGSSRAVVTLAGVTTASIILATLQEHAGGFTVESAVPRSDSFTIWLNQAAPSGGLPVGWFVIN